MQKTVKLVERKDITNKILRDLDYQFQDKFLPTEIDYKYDGYCYRTKEDEVLLHHPSKL